MKILFVKLSKNYIDQFSKFLIPTGIEFGLIDSYGEGVNILNSSTYDVAIEDIDYRMNVHNDIEPYKFIEAVKEERRLPTNIVVLTFHKDRSYLEKYIFKGILGIIYKSEDIYKTAKQFCFLLKSIPQFDKRKYLRIKPDQNENVFINIIVPDKNINIKTKITDISIKGAAFQSNGNSRALDLINHEIIQYITLFLYNRSVKISGRVLKRGKTAVVIFDKLSAYSEMLICRYIADGMVEVKV